MPAVIRTQISLTEAQMARLRKAAKSRHTSIAAVVREAVDSAVPDEDARRLELHRRMMAAAGAYRSGRPDIAENHDAYLDPDYEP
jgi:hypothetical protein